MWDEAPRRHKRQGKGRLRTQQKAAPSTKSTRCPANKVGNNKQSRQKKQDTETLHHHSTTKKGSKKANISNSRQDQRSNKNFPV
jgi:hypothetical protein